MKKYFLYMVILMFAFPFTYLEAQSIDLLWQGNTYTPPFYKGRALYSHDSSINFLAIPYGLGNPANLEYQWSRNGTILALGSGVGKNTLTFYDRVISRPQTIKVEILSPEQENTFGKRNALAETSVIITPRPPLLVIYENNPLYGFMFHQETGEIHKLKEIESTLTAFPLFFSTPNRISSVISYEWRTNAGGEPDRENSVTYRAPDDSAGSSAISVRALNNEEGKLLQSANKNFLIQFGQ